VLANLLDARFLLTAPYTQRDGTNGRLFVTSAERRFSVSDIEFLAQVSDALAAVFENIQLTEAHLARAAQDERAAISRDLHDTTIQPYIGLKLALEALRREAGFTGPAARRIDELVEMTGATVRDLRDYAARLRTRSAMPGEALAASVRKHAERLERFYGIAVEITSDIPPQIDGRLAAEAFQIVSEGLSNVLRHTRAKAAFVDLRRVDSTLVIEVSNEAAGAFSPQFLPRSIDERSRALGGRTTVEQRAADGYTVVRITLPS
jgi:signal transduction histidine kinase